MNTQIVQNLLVILPLNYVWNQTSEKLSTAPKDKLKASWKTQFAALWLICTLKAKRILIIMEPLKTCPKLVPWESVKHFNSFERVCQTCKSVFNLAHTVKSLESIIVLSELVREQVCFLELFSNFRSANNDTPNVSYLEQN